MSRCIGCNSRIVSVPNGRLVNHVHFRSIRHTDIPGYGTRALERYRDGARSGIDYIHIQSRVRTSRQQTCWESSTVVATAKTDNGNASLALVLVNTPFDPTNAGLAMCYAFSKTRGTSFAATHSRLSTRRRVQRTDFVCKPSDFE